MTGEGTNDTWSGQILISQCHKVSTNWGIFAQGVHIFQAGSFFCFFAFKKFEFNFLFSALHLHVSCVISVDLQLTSYFSLSSSYTVPGFGFGYGYVSGYGYGYVPGYGYGYVPGYGYGYVPGYLDMIMHQSSRSNILVPTYIQERTIRSYFLSINISCPEMSQADN